MKGRESVVADSVSQSATTVVVTCGVSSWRVRLLPEDAIMPVPKRADESVVRPRSFSLLTALFLQRGSKQRLTQCQTFGSYSAKRSAHTQCPVSCEHMLSLL